MPAVLVSPRRPDDDHPQDVISHPEPLWTPLTHPASFQEALAMQMARHGDTGRDLHRALLAAGLALDYGSILKWRGGTRIPRWTASLATLKVIAHRYRLEPDYFSSRVVRRPRRRSPRAEALRARPPRLAWHLPGDFADRPAPEQEEILRWIGEHILGDDIAFRRFQAHVVRHRYGLRLHGRGGRLRQAPARLRQEVEALVRFKSVTLTDLGFERQGVWGPVTVAQRKQDLMLMFGALTAPADGETRGLGVPSEDLTLALLVLPEIWDWYLRWRERRRGFYTIWEVDMLLLGRALTRPHTGWLRQAPWLAERLRPIPGLVEEARIRAIQGDWNDACDRMSRYARALSEDVRRVRRVHRDPFQPILPILDSDSPVGEYRKITQEIVRRMPDPHRKPLAAAESVRAILMLRLGLHLGLRTKNLRQLLLCPRGRTPRTEWELEALERGELRWSARDKGWEVFIPCRAFKNGTSAYFARQPFRLLLPDVDDLYHWIDLYIRRDRPLLLHGLPDPHVFFIRTVRRTGCDPTFTYPSFYSAWRKAIERYGIYNPWTGQGAIEGLKSHGPHCVRDVLATHVLKHTGSYEQAGCAIQDSPRTVARHYARFLPADKAAMASRVLNAAWASADNRDERDGVGQGEV